VGEKCTLIKEKFVNKVFKIRNRKQKRPSHKIKIEKPQERERNKKPIDPTCANTISKMLKPREGRYGFARIRQAVWIMYTTMSSTTVEHKLYDKFIASLKSSFHIRSRNTESKEEVILYGLFFKALTERIQISAKYFNFKSFMIFQCDCWTG